MVTPARWRNGSSGWSASSSTPDRDPAGAGRGSSRIGEQAGAAGGRGRGKQSSSQPEGVRGSWRPRPVAPSGTSKQNQKQCFATYNSKITQKFY